VALADGLPLHTHEQSNLSGRGFRARGRPDDAASTAAEAFAILEAKGDVAGAAQFRCIAGGAEVA
jgi:hypothetical protein